MADYLCKHTYDILNLIVIILGLFISARLVIRQLKTINTQNFYDKFITLESDISDTNKDFWGINDDNEIIISNGDRFKINLDKLSYLLRFLDTYCAKRALNKKNRVKVYSEYSQIYKMFQSKIYRDYWNYIVRYRFYYNAPKRINWIQKFISKKSEDKYQSGFITAIEKTIQSIENKKTK